MYKRFKPYIAICLLVQSVSMVILFFLLYRKKRSIANTILALAAVSGAVGGVMFWQEYGEALGLKAASPEDEGALDFDDLDLGIDDEMLGAELRRDDEADEKNTAGYYDDVPAEDSSEDDFKGI